LDNPVSIGSLVLRLEDVLRDLIGQHEHLARHLIAKRTALAAAEHDRIVKLLEVENAVVQAVAEADKMRQQIVADLTLQLNPTASAPIPLCDLAQQLEEPHCGRLLALREQLRDRMLTVQRESAVARSATEALARHMQGLLHTIQTVCSGGTAYEAGGASPSVAKVMSTFTATA